MTRISCLLASVLLLGGCLNPSMVIDQRSALEQELTRTALARAVERLPIHKAVLDGTWKIEVTAPDARDQSWIESCLRDRLVALGAKISRDTDAELPTVEARVLTAGSDVDNFYIGLPVNLSGSYQTLSFYQSITNYGRARMGLTFWNEGGGVVARTPEVKTRAHFTSIFVLTFIGAFSSNDLGERTWGRFLELGEDEWRQVRAGTEWVVPPEGEPTGR